MKKWSSLCLSALLAGALLAGCGGAAPAAASSEAGSVSAGASSASAPQSESAGGYTTTLADIRQKGTLVIGLDDTFAPMGFRDESGELVGFDIDLANAVCEQLGVTAEFQPIDWDPRRWPSQRAPSTASGTAWSITPERQEAMSLSQAYFEQQDRHSVQRGRDNRAKEGPCELQHRHPGGQRCAGGRAGRDEALYAAIEGQLTEYPHVRRGDPRRAGGASGLHDH